MTEHVEEPLLGLATTRELLAEVESRMRIDPRGWDFLASVCRDGLDLLPDEVLSYRTAEPRQLDATADQPNRRLLAFTRYPCAACGGSGVATTEGAPDA